MSEFRCANSTFHNVASGGYIAARVLLALPLSVLVLRLGHRRRRPPLPPSTHSDAFALHMAAAELLWDLGVVLTYGGLLPWGPLLAVAGTFLVFVSFYMQTFLHLLTCAERYLAVVHPVAYRGLRSARGVRRRDLSVGCVYALSAAMSLVSLQGQRLDPVAALLGIIVTALAAASFFSLSVLLALIRPGPGGPGGPGGAGGRVDPSRQRAFLVILAVLVALWSWFLGLLVPAVLRHLHLDQAAICAVEASGFWLSLPSGLLLHLLYLHRARKLPRCPARR